MNRVLITLLTAQLIGCGGIVGGPSDHENPPDDGVSVSQYSNKVLLIANQTILSTRPQATQMIVKNLNLVLANNNIVDVAVQDSDVEDNILAPLSNGQPENTCPYLAQSTGLASVSCRYLLDRAIEDTLSETTTLEDTIEQDVHERYVAELAELELDFVKGWVGQSILSGIDAGSVHALFQLRQTKACDQAPTPTESAYKLGEQQGQALLEATETDVLPTVPNTICNTDTVAATVLAAAKQKVTDYVQGNPICAGYAAEDLAVAVDLAQAEKNRLDGLEEGMLAAYEALRVRLVNTWTCVSPPTGDPLVVDLDGNGVQLSQRAVSFDLAATGEPVQFAALGGKDAFLALDLDGSGQIESGAELLGNASPCQGQRCTDGVEALAAHDGNQDGVIDAKDAVFKKLRLWTDRNADGQSTASELRSLASAGIQAIKLDGRFDQAFGTPRGSSLRSLTFVRTDGSAGTVFDVWLGIRPDGAPKDPRTMGVTSTLPLRR